MRTHRIIFWTTLLIFIIGLPLIMIISLKEDIKNILIGIICSSLVATIVELPNLINYKSNIKSSMYNGLFNAKMFLLQYNDDIDKRLLEKEFRYTQYGAYYLNNISIYINMYNQCDDTIFTLFSSKKNELIDSKKVLYNLYNSIYSIYLLIEILRIKMELKECTINDVHTQLKSIKIANNNLILEIDNLSKKVLSKKQLDYYEDNSNRIIKALKNEANK